MKESVENCARKFKYHQLSLLGFLTERISSSSRVNRLYPNIL